MTKKLAAFLPLFVLTVSIYAQDSIPSSSINTLEKQFNEVVDGSNNYQDYKVIKKFQINKLRENIMDSVSSLEARVDSAQIKIDTQQATISSLENNLAKVNEDLALSQKKENGIEIFGIITEKSTYNTIMWSIIGILLIGLGFFIYKFKNSHAVTKNAELKLAETEIEFEAHRQKKLEEQQQLRRKLQDEINKNRKG
ncbi:hypothetical protein ACFQO1_05120 [Jejudonia soesokkakensis]|uniref:tRNA (Guanine-N1)-methyltransferase n=1 Tax=Jejudonia soesokkakensis TaxID=1323432 RepID=A0ABW2MSI7_9FLAO